jgi:protein-S-isoprenylcysteine O-methyltransferase Ste14
LPLIFGINDYSLVFVFAILTWLASEVVGGRIIPSLRRSGSRVEQRKKGLNIVVGVGWVVFFGISVNLAAQAIAFLQSWAYFAGIVLMLSGVAVRQWAIAVLGRYFSNVIGIQQNQTVVQSGPYRLIRHPSYTGILLIQVGIAFALQSWAAILAAVLIFSLVYGHRILREEGFLVKELGDDYVQYMKHTKRIIPFLI